MDVFVIAVPTPIRAIADRWAQDYLALSDVIVPHSATRESRESALQFKFWLCRRVTLFRELSRSTEPVLATDLVLADVADTAYNTLDPTTEDGLTEEATQVLVWLETLEKRPISVCRAGQGGAMHLVPVDVPPQVSAICAQWAAQVAQHLDALSASYDQGEAEVLRELRSVLEVVASKAGTATVLSRQHLLLVSIHAHGMRQAAVGAGATDDAELVLQWLRPSLPGR